MLYWLKPILNSDQDLTLSQQKQILTGLLVTKTYKNRTMKISLFSYFMLGYISSITTSLPHIYRRIIPPRNILDKFSIIWDLCGFLQVGLISSTIFCKKLHFPTVNHNRYIKLHWAQFPMIGNTYLELKLTSLKSFIKTFCYNNKVTSKVTKRLPKLSNKEMYLTLLI